MNPPPCDGDAIEKEEQNFLPYEMKILSKEVLFSSIWCNIFFNSKHVLISFFVFIPVFCYQCVPWCMYAGVLTFKAFTCVLDFSTAQ